MKLVDRIFSKDWLPLEPSIVDCWAKDLAGIYFIRRGEEVVYIGRSDKSVRKRLLNHCRRFHCCSFSTEYHPRGIKLDRLEYSLIENFKLIFNLENRIHASIRTKKPRPMSIRR